MSTDHFVNPDLFVPDGTKQNYADAARAAAKANGTTVAEEWAAIVAQFEANHQADGAAGWNHLAAWAKATDPETVGGTVDATELRKARQLASAIQDPGEADLLAEDSEAKDAVEHAHRTLAERGEAGPFSPAGSDSTELGKAEDSDEGTEKRAGRRPSRNTAESAPKETR